jgi:hypothetical protein
MGICENKSPNRKEKKGCLPCFKDSDKKPNGSDVPVNEKTQSNPGFDVPVNKNTQPNPGFDVPVNKNTQSNHDIDIPIGENSQSKLMKLSSKLPPIAIMSEQEKEEMISTLKFLQINIPINYTSSSVRDIVRFNVNKYLYPQSVEEMNKEDAYYEFVSINTYYEQKKYKTFPEGFFNWKDPYLVSKLESQIERYNENIKVLDKFVAQKPIFDHHPETMPMYVGVLRHEDFIWQLLNRQLSIYKKFYPIVDDKTIEYVDHKMKDELKIYDILKSIR